MYPGGSMKNGFILYSLLVASSALCMLTLAAVRTMGMSCAALRIQCEEDAVFSKICIAIRYQQWLITHFYDLFLSQIVSQKKLLVLETAFDSILRCGTPAAWGTSTFFGGLFCETVLGKRRCRWRALRRGGGYVFSGHTFTVV